MTRQSASETHGSVTELVGRLRALDTCTVSDALDSLGIPGACSQLLPVWEGAKLAGRVLTVTVRPVLPDVPRSKVHLGVAALERAEQGDIVVVDNGGRVAMGAWGGLLTAAAVERALGGVVVYGACRDVDEVRALQFPIFALAPSTRTARGRVAEMACGDPVEIDGIAVESNDLVLADGTGVVFLPSARALEVIATSELIASKEGAMLASLRAGVRPATVLSGEYEQMLDKAP